MTHCKSQLKAILIDDEIIAISNLSNFIGSYCPTITIIDTATSVVEASSKINQLTPDVIFLDVNMPGQSGFDLLSQLNYTPSVVFVTAHEKHALRALKMCAVDFLLKPIEIEELIKVEAKLQQIHAFKPEIRKNYSRVLNNLAALIDQPDSVRKITLYGNNGYEIFEMDDILYLSGEDNYSSFHFLNNKKVIMPKTLKSYEEMLEPFGFMRIHKSTLVNLAHIKKVITKDTIAALLKNDQYLSVSRRRATQLLNWVKKN